MKRIISILLLSTIIFAKPANSQIEYGSNRLGCATEDIAPGGLYPPFKTPNTIDYGAATNFDVIKVVIVFVKFANDNFDQSNSNWSGSSSMPTFGNNLLATFRHGTGQTDWWNFYDPNTECLSSWFCEASRGKMHVIGDVYTVTLAHEYSYYQDDERGKEGELNEEIFEYLDQVLQVDWRDYDKWGYENGDFYYSNNGDKYVDMVFRIFRYNYGDIFSYDLSGWAYLGEIGTRNQEYYPLSHDKRMSGKTPVGYEGSGLTVMGNGSSGILDKNGTVARLAHEFGHWLFGSGHSNIGRMGGGGEYFLDPWERIKLNFLTSSEIQTFGVNDDYLDFTLQDYSARTSGKSLLKIDLGGDENFLISSRRRISKWDVASSGDTLLGNPFTSIDPENYGYGKGVYIYHNNDDWEEDSYPNDKIDIECADGLWGWHHSGNGTPDWSYTQNWLPVMDKIALYRYANDDGVPGVIPSGGYYGGKDGISIQSEESGFHCLDPDNNPIRCVVGKYFSPGEKESSIGLLGTDKMHTNNISRWTSRELLGDRYDAWQEGEIFSPYSSPSTYKWDNTGAHKTFVWVYDIDETNNTTRFKIYRESGTLSETQILAETPPSKPMNLRLIEFYPPGTPSICHPELVWSQNIEPDMKNPNYEDNLFYEIYRVSASTMNTIPNLDNAQLIATVNFPSTEGNPYYIDYSIKKYDCVNLDGPPYGNPFPVRYFIKAVDKYGTKSVRSDFVATVGLDDSGGKENGDKPFGLDEIPLSYELHQNYPNPFNPSTNIQFDLPNDATVSLKIYDMLGREVATLVNEFRNAGRYIIGFDGSKLSSGVYYYKIKAGNFEQTRRMVLVK